MISERQPCLAFRGTLVDCPASGEVRVRRDTLCIVDPTVGGRIAGLWPGSAEAEVLQAHQLDARHVIRLQERELLLPGFVDCHIHAPQYPFSGTATDEPLMQWLDKYTFPTEARFQDLAFAREAFRSVVNRTLAHGTTTATYYGTLHEAPCRVLADVVEELGQRALVGKVSMDRNSPASYCETTQEGVESCESFVQYVLAKQLSRLAPVVTPRFVPTCTPALLAGCGAVAARHGVHIQSHVSESYDAVAFVEALHPEAGGRDLALLETAGLLTPKTLLAHCTLLSDEELRHMAKTGAAIATCPLSNFFFADSLLRVRHVLRLGVKVGLGTDVAGGYSPSMLSAIRAAVLASKALHIQNIQRTCDPGSAALHYQQHGDPDVLSWKEGLWLATMGGAEALNWQDRIGSFEPGKEFDALRVDTTQRAAFDGFPSDSILHRLEKFVNLGDDRNISEVWVQGRRVAGAAAAEAR